MADEQNKEIGLQLPIGRLGKVFEADSELVNDLNALHERESVGVLKVFPERIAFETQESDEQIIIMMRRHPVTNLRWILLALLMALSPLVLPLLDAFPAEVPSRYIVVGTLLWELFVIGFVFEEFLRWYFNIYIVTDRRVVDIDFTNLLSRELSDADLVKIQDVSVKNQGLLAAFFNFGDITVQTAGEQMMFEFLSVGHAEKVASVIQLLAQHRNEEMEDGSVGSE